MSADNDEPLLDAFLAEVLGSRQPPDLTARILQRWAEQSGQPNLNGHPISPSPQLVSIGSAKELVALPISALTTEHSSREQRISRKPRAAAPGVTFSGIVAASLALAVIGLGLAIGLWSMAGARHERFANSQPKRLSEPLPAPPRSALEAPRVAHAPQGSDHEIGNAAAPQPASDSTQEPAKSLAVHAPPAPIVEQHSLQVVSPPAAPPARSVAETVAVVNQELEKLWVSAGVKPAVAVADDEWCQRAYQGVLGRNARPAEVKRFGELSASSRREQLVEQLLTERRYQDEFVAHWSSIWTNRLIGPRGGLQNSLAKRDDLQSYLAAAIRAGRPWSVVAENLLTATGSSTADGSDYNPAVNFLLDRWDSNALTATSRVSQVFLGHQLQCAQCHQHPTEGWSQEQFWSLNAFFRQIRVDRASGTPRLTNVDFLGQRRGSRDGEVFFETPTGLMKTAFPRFIDGTQIATSGLISAVDRRKELAKLVVQSDDFAQATVNFVWTQLYGYGLARPSSEQSSESPHARILQELATEFVASGYSLKNVIRWAVLADPYSRSAELTDLATKDLPEAGQLPLFSRFYEQPPARTETNRLLAAAARIRTNSTTEVARKQARRDWLVQANRVDGNAPKSPAPKGAKSKAPPPSSIIADAGPVSTVATSRNDHGLIARLLASSMPFEKKAEHVFLAAIGRQPNARETTTTGELLAASGNSETAALEDLWWALVNSSECVLDR